MATMVMATIVLIGLLATLPSSNRKKNECARPKDERGDYLFCRANLKIETLILNVVAVAMYNNVIVERMLRALEFEANMLPWIEVQWSRKNIEKSRRSTIGLSEHENDQILVYSNAQYFRGINKTRTMESFGSKSNEEEEHNCERR